MRKKLQRMVSTERVRSSCLKKVGRRAGKGSRPAAESGTEKEVQLARETNMFLSLQVAAPPFLFLFGRKILSQERASYYDSTFMYLRRLQLSFSQAFATFPT